jgi:TDG/mug DNA glycosylase family protein
VDGNESRTKSRAVIKSSFPSVIDGAARVLILGSLPGEESLRRGQYYANERNQFWRLMESVTGAALDSRLPYEERVAALQSAGIALWDVVQSATRRGSLDADIRDHTVNALGEFAANWPNLRALAFNGRKAFDIGRRQFGSDFKPRLIALPSSSPAHTMAFAAKEAEWLQLKAFLDPTP